MVGYGPNPNECIDLLKQLNLTCLAGNHDRAATGDLDTADFNPDARSACEWTADRLTESSREFLRSLEPAATVNGVHLAHGSPRDPLLEYTSGMAVAAANFEHFNTRLCMVGHTHVPVVFSRHQTPDQNPEYRAAVPAPDIPVDVKAEKLIVNPGSVGQPRDGDPNAAYMIYDPAEETLSLARREYDVARTQAAMRRQNLPERLVERLSYGW